MPQPIRSVIHFLEHWFLILFSISVCVLRKSSIRFSFSLASSIWYVYTHSLWLIYSNAYEVLQCLWVHSQFFYIAVIGVLAHMRCNVWQLYTIDITLPWVNRYCYKWYSIVIVEKQSTVTINGLYILGVLLPHNC